MKFLKQKKGFNIGMLIYGVIGVVIAVTVIPVASNQITQSLGNYSATERTLLQLVPTMLVVGVLIGALVYAGLKMSHK